MKQLLVTLILFTATQTTFCGEERKSDILPTWAVSGTIFNGPQVGYIIVERNNKFHAAFKTKNQANQFVALVSGGMDEKAAQKEIDKQDYYHCSIQ